MQIITPVQNIALTVLLLVLSSQPVFAKKMYRWVDETGNVRYSDQVPPDQVKYRRESLNENARVVNVVEKQKTKAQRDLEKRLFFLRKQQEEIISKQKSNDKVLLSTYRNLSDLEMALKGRMIALDGQRSVVQGNLQRIEKQLQQQQKKAAQYERDGRKIPKKLLEKISSSKKQVELTYVELSKQFEKKKAVREAFEEDLIRFAFLSESNIEESEELSQQTAEKKAENELGLFICNNVKQCDKAWLIARQFIYMFSTTDLDIESDKLIMSQLPYRDSDISLSVSKMEMDENRQQLFLDIRCRISSIGNELCRSAKAIKIRTSFGDFIKSALGIKIQ